MTELLTEHRDKLESLTRILLEEETLDEDQSYAAALVPHPTPEEREALRNEKDAARQLSAGNRNGSGENEADATPEGDRPDGGGTVPEDERPGLEIAPRPGIGDDTGVVPEPTRYAGTNGWANPEKPNG